MVEHSKSCPASRFHFEPQDNTKATLLTIIGYATCVMEPMYMCVLGSNNSFDRLHTRLTAGQLAMKLAIDELDINSFRTFTSAPAANTPRALKPTPSTGVRVVAGHGGAGPQAFFLWCKP